jgi:hypothetical protein
MPMPEEELPYMNSLGRQIKEHWRKYLPKGYAALAKEGTLEAVVIEAPQRTTDALYDLTIRKGLAHDQAWELIRETHQTLAALFD